MSIKVSKSKIRPIKLLKTKIYNELVFEFFKKNYVNCICYRYNPIIESSSLQIPAYIQTNHKNF